MDVSAGINFGQPAPEVAPFRIGAGQFQRLPVAGRRLIRAAQAAVHVRLGGRQQVVTGQLAGYHLLPATKADMYRRLGRADEAAACYREAMGLASTDAEQRYLGRRLAEAASAAGTGSG